MITHDIKIDAISNIYRHSKTLICYWIIFVEEVIIIIIVVVKHTCGRSISVGRV